MKSDYCRDIFKQLEETMKRLDKMEATLEYTKIVTVLPCRKDCANCS